MKNKIKVCLRWWRYCGANDGVYVYVRKLCWQLPVRPTRGWSAIHCFVSSHTFPVLRTVSFPSELCFFSSLVVDCRSPVVRLLRFFICGVFCVWDSSSRTDHWNRAYSLMQSSSLFQYIHIHEKICLSAYKFIDMHWRPFKITDDRYVKQGSA